MLKLKNEKGYNIVTTMVTVVIIIILITIAMVCFSRFRIQANEVAALSQLMKIASCFETYKAVMGQYPTALLDLKNLNPRCIDDNLIDTGIRRGYEFMVSSDTIPTYSFIMVSTIPTYTYSFIIYCKPTHYASPPFYQGTGIRSFIMNERGFTWETDQEIPPGQDPGNPENPSSPSYGGGGGWGPSGSCPYIYVWNGKGYIKDNDILPGANPIEQSDFYLLSERLVPKDNLYSLKISEELDEVSYLDKLSLIQVEHAKDVSIAPNPQGKLFTYKTDNLIKPRQALDKDAKSVLREISSKGTGDYHGYPDDYIILNFGRIKQNQYGARLILSADLCTPGGWGTSLHIQFLDNKQNWQEISVVHPHEKWDIWAVDLTKVLSQIDKELKVKVVWSREHKLDYCLLDISKQEPINIKQLALLSARHIKKDDLFARLFNSDRFTLNRLLHSDNRYAVMKKGDEISLEFGAEPATDLTKDFILTSEGYYIAQNKKISWRRLF